MSKKFLDLDGLSYLWLLITNKLGLKVDKEFKTGSTSAYKVLSDNNLTDALVEKINNASSSSFSGDYSDLMNKPDLTEKEDVVNKTKTVNASSTDTQYPTAKAVYTVVSGKADASGLSTVATSGSYNDLSNKPTIPTNNNQLTNGAGYQTASDVQTAINSALSGVTGYTETAPTVPTWAKQSTKPTYTYDEITDKPTFSEVATSGSYNNLKDKPTIPSIEGLATEEFVTDAILSAIGGVLNGSY